MADPKLEFEISGNLTVDAIYMPEGIRIGDVSSGEVNQDNTAIAIGLNAGFQDQSNNAIAIGMKAGNSNQAKRSIAIGEEAGFSNQEKLSVAIGRSAGKDNQKEGAVALGYDTGKENQGLKAIAIGFGAGRYDQSNNSIAIGNNAGKEKLGDKSIAIGYEAEIDNSSSNVTQNVIVLNATDSSLNSDVSSALFIKPLRDVSNVSTPVGRTRNDYKIMVYESSSGEVAYDASYNGTTSGGGGTPALPLKSVQFNAGGFFGGNSNFTYDKVTNLLELSGTLVMPQGVAIGNFSTHTNNPSSIAIGVKTGFSNQGSKAIAIGQEAGVINQKDNTIAIGYIAGQVDQSNNAIAIGAESGQSHQSEYSIAIGAESGQSHQSEYSIAIGTESGQSHQSEYSIAIGTAAGQNLQSEYSIAIGYQTGGKYLGEKSIAIGYEADFDNTSTQTQNVIVLNATESSLNSDVSSALFIKPLRDVSNVSTPVGRTRNDYKIMVYDSSSGEIAYDASYNGTSNIDLTNINAVSVSAETITVSNSLFLGSITYEDASLSSVSVTPTQITLNTPIILFDISNTSNNYYTDISNQGQTGQTLDIFMETNGGTVKVDFGINTLVTAGGIFRYLTFNSMGQSASLIYIGSKWRIRNSGALPGVS